MRIRSSRLKSLQAQQRDAGLHQPEGRGWRSEELRRFATDPEDGVAMGFSDKRLHRGLGGHIKERPGNRDVGHILLQDRRGVHG
jgi:hypothetical protein